jgi:hypothetical protein
LERPGAYVQRFLPTAKCKVGLCTTALAVFSGDVVKRPELIQAVAVCVTVGMESETDAHLLIAKAPSCDRRPSPASWTPAACRRTGLSDGVCNRA